MSWKRISTWSARGGPILAGMLIGAAFMMGLADQPSPAAPQSRSTPRPTAFKSGAERSLEVLQDISQTLDRIDVRLQRIEQVVVAASRRSADETRTRADRGETR